MENGNNPWQIIPRFWAYGVNPHGGSPLWCSSAISEEDAKKRLQKRIRQTYNVASGWGGMADTEEENETVDYPVTVLREELLAEFNDDTGSPIAFMTRNYQWALVLNLRNMLVFDWDCVPRKDSFLRKILRGGFALLTACFRKKKAFDPDRVSYDEEQTKFRYPWLFEPLWTVKESKVYNRSHGWSSLPPRHRPIDVLRPLVQLVACQPEWSVRIYQTAGGYRGIVTHRLFFPKLDAAGSVMRLVRCDERYTRFCYMQDTFRVRVSPKGWRCGLKPSMIRKGYRPRYPWKPDDSEAAELYAKGVALYEEMSRPYAVCRYLGTIGSDTILPETRTLVELHDKMTLAPANDPNRPLA